MSGVRVKLVDLLVTTFAHGIEGFGCSYTPEGVGYGDGCGDVVVGQRLKEYFGNAWYAADGVQVTITQVLYMPACFQFGKALFRPGECLRAAA